MVTAHTARPFQDKEFDTFTTAAGSFDIYFLGHGSLAIALGDFVTYIDPVSDQGNFTHYPKADLILVTHEHAQFLQAYKNPIAQGNNFLETNAHSSS